MTTKNEVIQQLSEAFERETTGLELNASDAFVGLTDFGLFAEKMPSCFSSEGLSEHLTPQMKTILDEQDLRKQRKLIDKHVHYSIRYQAMRDINVPRHMSVPHPESHLLQCFWMKKVWADIKNHCAVTNEPFSRIFVRKIRDSKRVFEMNYRGPERWDQEEDELRFQTGAQYAVHSDISKCFPSIYSHSIPWAMHGKSDAKKNRGLLRPGNLLDKSCQIVSDAQTNGLQIGPHTSNVISEIILTSIDAALCKKGYTRVVRYIDDYHFYAETREEAESFIRELSMQLREYELHVNEGKTRILSLPQPVDEEWVRELNTFQFSDGEIAYSETRRFLDLALSLVEKTGKSSVLNYAIQKVPERLNGRARKMFTQEVFNLTLQYPYLAPVLEKHLFEKHNVEKSPEIDNFCKKLLEMGVLKIHPDAIAHSLYYAIKFDVKLSGESLLDIVPINDCVSLVLLCKYAEKYKLVDVQKKVHKKADTLKNSDRRDIDQFGLLVYQVWSADELKGNGQVFLAELKEAGFSFIKFASPGDVVADYFDDETGGYDE